jgi:hypothetical protein
MNIPNHKTYRPWLGEEVNRALFILVEHRNNKALFPLSVSDYIEKMVASWWKKEFLDVPVPFQCKRYDEDLNI